MTIDEYNEKRNALKEKYDREDIAIMKQYASENNPYKIGDIIKDNSKSIRVETMQYYLYKDCPCMVYKGVRINKDGTDNKRKETEFIYQMNIQDK